jgi:hypothetical protein
MGKRYALCIGVNKYVNAKPINLRFARPDAEELASALRDRLRGGFDQVEKLLDEQATKASARQAIDNLLQSPLRQPDDLILLFFSGHGVRDKQGDLCLVPSDFRYHGDGSPDFASLVHAKELEVSIGNSNVQNIVLLIDCCHSGALGKVMGRTSLGDDTNLFVIGAARSSESALEIEKLGHGVFTECLMRALNLPPDKGEWITLGRIIAFIGEEIKKFGVTQLMQSTSHYVDLGIVVARNPSYSILSTEFTSEVARIFELANYELDSSSTHHSYPNFFVARMQVGFRTSKTGVLCLDNRKVKVTNAHIQQFASLTRQLHADHDIADGILVTCDDLPASMRRDIEASGITSCSTSADLLRSLLDFERYLRQLTDEFELDGFHRPGEPAPAKYYVELEAETKDKKWRGLAIDYVRRWSSKTDELQLALLGEYGSGKTTFCRKLARDLASKYLQARGRGKHRIPIIIPLSEFPRGQADIEAFITGYLARRCGVTNPNFEAFRAMNDAGFLLLIFDGFDEMAVHVDADVIQANLMQIERLAASPNSKVLLTSRPEYFTTSVEEQQALQPAGLLARHSKYRRLYLCGFGEKQIQTFLQKRIPLIPNVTQDWSYYYGEIKRIHDLSDLSSRPVLLEMIVKTLPELVAQGKPVSRSMLYQTYLEGELQRQAIEKRRELLIKREDRLRMMQTVALHFYAENPYGLAADLVQVLVHDQMSPEQLDEFEAYTRDFLTCSFLTRHGNDYAFSHRSFVEYLAAKALFEEVKDNVPKFFGERRLAKEVIEFLVELIPSQYAPTLHQWIRSTAYKTFEEVRYLGTNSIVILARLGEDLGGSDFAGSVLNEADLKRSIFKGAVFAHASLNKVDFTGAVLDHCNFAQADLKQARLVSVKARDCKFSEAYLDLTDLTGSDLSGSDLRGCVCYEANFQDVIANDCKLTSLDGILNPSSSLTLLAVDIRGVWTESVDTGYKEKLWIVEERVGHISGKLQRSDRTWIEFEGLLQQGKYSLKGIGFSEERVVITERFLNDLRSYNVPSVVLEKIEGWKGQSFPDGSRFLRKLGNELESVRELSKRKKDLDRHKKRLNKLEKEIRSKKNNLKTKEFQSEDCTVIEQLREDLAELEAEFNRLKEEFDRLEAEFDRHKIYLESVKFEAWSEKIADLMGLQQLVLERFTVRGGQYTGWLTVAPGNYYELWLHLSRSSGTSLPETIKIFVR